ncbi:MAG: ABC transporter ATP-binding protein [Acidobacteriota bacterium]|nr:ABC transporter ATP-binding protein [Acidobacteriota bacterium]
MTPLLQFRDVGFRFGDREVIQAASLELIAGSCTALIGPNGVGKTTMLRLAAGTLKSQTGEVLLHGIPLRTQSRKRIACSIALVPQQLEIPFQFTVRQVVEQGRTPYLGLLRGPVRQDRIAVDRALDLADVASLQHRIFEELSGGERQRVKIALGLAQEPELLLLDEPTQNLDIGRQVELIDLLHFLLAEGITIFASMHDLQLVKGNFSSVVLLSPDTPLVCGTPDEMLRPALLEKAFNCPPRRHPMLVERLERQLDKQTRKVV